MLSASAPLRRYLALLFAGCLTAALALAVVDPAVAGKPSGGGGGSVLPTPFRIVVKSVTSGVALPTGLPAPGPSSPVPYVVVKAGETFRVTVDFVDAEGFPAAFTKDTTLTITSNVGTLTSGTGTGTALKGISTATIDASLTTAVNRVVLTVRAGSGPKAPEEGMSYVADVKDLRFDVLTDVSPLLPGMNGYAFVAGFGGRNDCAEATESAPVCQVVLLPRGAGTDVLLSVGACDIGVLPLYAPCFSGASGVGGAVVQALFTQPSRPYSPISPLTIVVKCDKLLCGGGPISARTVLWSLRGNGPLESAKPCPAKGTMAEAGKPCVDYVQSRRDGSGDTHLYLLTDRDIRTGIG